jgi:hypothetical protein
MSGPSVGRFHRTIRYGMVIAIAGCSPALTDDAVVLVGRAEDWEQTEAAAAEFRPHIGVSVTVTDDPNVYHNWPTEERWTVLWVGNDTEVRVEGESATVCPTGRVDAIALTNRTRREILLGECLLKETTTAPAIAHEVGHMAGASDCDDGVMRRSGVKTTKPSQATIDELHELY